MVFKCFGKHYTISNKGFRSTLLSFFLILSMVLLVFDIFPCSMVIKVHRY